MRGEIYPDPWIIHETRGGQRFPAKTFPRGTFLWNDNPHILVYVEKFFRNPLTLTHKAPILPQTKYQPTALTR